MLNLRRILGMCSSETKFKYITAEQALEKSIRSAPLAVIKSQEERQQKVDESIRKIMNKINETSSKGGTHIRTHNIRSGFAGPADAIRESDIRRCKIELESIGYEIVDLMGSRGYFVIKWEHVKC